MTRTRDPKLVGHDSFGRVEDGVELDRTDRLVLVLSVGPKLANDRRNALDTGADVVHQGADLAFGSGPARRSNRSAASITYCSGLLTSWATPAAIIPSPAKRSAWASCARIRPRSVTSRAKARTAGLPSEIDEDRRDLGGDGRAVAALRGILAGRGGLTADAHPLDATAHGGERVGLQKPSHRSADQLGGRVISEEANRSGIRIKHDPVARYDHPVRGPFHHPLEGGLVLLVRLVRRTWARKSHVTPRAVYESSGHILVYVLTTLTPLESNA